MALLGPNGAGKTTALRILAGLIAPTRGEGQVAGVGLRDRSRQALRARVGLLTEMPGLWDRLTVRANLLTYARLHGVDAPAARVHALLEQLGLVDRADDRAGVLSKGLRQRVALARALVGDPVVLFLDEPTSGLDPAAARTVRDVIEEARRQGVSVLLSTHQLDEAEALADRVAVLKQTLLALDTPDGLRRRLLGPPQVVIDLDGDADAWAAALADVAATVKAAGRSTLAMTLAFDSSVADVVATLVNAGARVRGVREDRPSLEAAYLSLVDGDD